ncbi:hypothetical protein [Microvirga brassicacearum]|uniref:GNAT family N-acetyltransferase n=1 Tax=Microvirga brassicacearum TaxID=2580413 RepID=A0A5N3PFF3_9HYPH|nr:hypothetical protein [Microvirga brassicacearum]KAB0268472.1 hypothetical protein FEZ63_05625 [Microvirga brassicacearum]
MERSQFSCRNGRTVTIAIDEDDDYGASVSDEQGNPLGRLVFRLIEDGECLKLVWAYLDHSDRAWCRQGLGREILRRVKELSGLPVTASDNDGHTQDDGSHLTGDAPAFVARMREEGLIAPGAYDRHDEEEVDW